MASATSALPAQAPVFRPSKTNNMELAVSCAKICGFCIALPVLLPLSPLITAFAVGRNLFFNESNVKKQTLKTNTFSPLAMTRFQTTEKRVQEFAKRAGFKNPEAVKLLVGKTPFVPHMLPSSMGHKGNGHVLIPPHFLMRKEDLPDNLSLEKLDNGTLTEDAWIENFEKWLFNDQLKTDYLYSRGKLTDADKTNLKAWLRLFRNPDYDRMIDWVMAHELGHVDHSDSYRIALMQLCSFFVALGVAAAIVASIVLFLPTSLFLTVALSIILGNISFNLAFKLFTDIIFTGPQRKNETRADEFATKITQDPEAGMLFFKDVMETLKAYRAAHPELKHMFSENGDTIGNRKHPLYADRIEHLRKLRDQMQRRAQLATV